MAYRLLMVVGNLPRKQINLYSTRLVMVSTITVLVSASLTGGRAFLCAYLGRQGSSAPMIKALGKLRLFKERRQVDESE